MHLLETVGSRPLFGNIPAGECDALYLETILRSTYEAWRVINGVENNFVGDIQYLLSNLRVRQQLAANLFQHGPPEISQLRTTLELLVLSSYSRHLVVLRTLMS